MADNKPDSTAATAQSRAPSVAATRTWHAATESQAEEQFTIAPGATDVDRATPYRRKPGDPVYRPLNIFTLDPSISPLDGALAVLKVPYEALAPGPVGALFEVDNDDGFQRNQRVDLDDPRIVMNDGLPPTPSDPRFHQQMTYAVCSSVYAAFQTALGRHVMWSFPQSAGRAEGRLLIRPHGFQGNNAYYDKQAGALVFGYYRAPPRVTGRNLPDSWVFTCLSHDIVAHEVTHALLDALRANFTIPSNPDVLAFHEAFADLVAVFQHFTYQAVVERAIASSRGDLQLAPMLTDLAGQFSQTQPGAMTGQALRSAVDRRRAGEQPRQYGQDSEPHALGSVLVAAIFDAFVTVFERKTRRFIRLATGGSGLLPAGELPTQLVAILAEQAAHLASQFLTMCIRAIDYCPPVDLLFGEYLRALITADYALVPDDPWSYREALVDSFRAHGIHPIDVPNLSQDALLWRTPEEALPACAALDFAALRFRGDPSMPASAQEVQRQARELGMFITAPRRARLFGLMTQAEAAQAGIVASLPTIHSIRSTRRVGPQGQIVFDLVAEVTQHRTVQLDDGTRMRFHGGATIILDPDGCVRYVIAKGIHNAAREARQRAFVRSPEGRRVWTTTQQHAWPQAQLFRLLHATR